MCSSSSGAAERPAPARIYATAAPPPQFAGRQRTQQACQGGPVASAPDCPGGPRRLSMSGRFMSRRSAKVRQRERRPMAQCSMAVRPLRRASLVPGAGRPRGFRRRLSSALAKARVHIGGLVIRSPHLLQPGRHMAGGFCVHHFVADPQEQQPQPCPEVPGRHSDRAQADGRGHNGVEQDALGGGATSTNAGRMAASGIRAPRTRSVMRRRSTTKPPRTSGDGQRWWSSSPCACSVLCGGHGPTEPVRHPMTDPQRLETSSSATEFIASPRSLVKRCTR